MADLILTERSNIVAIADAVRCRTGETGEMTIGKIVNDINYVVGSIEPSLQDKTVTPSTSTQTITADSGYDGLSKVTVSAMPTATQATPSITVNSSGLITATATQTAGYVAAGTKSATQQLTIQGAKTITPSTSSQTAVASGVYTTGAVTVAAIPSSYKNTSDATASADEIMQGETAYVNGSKVTGTFTIDSELTTQDDLIAQIQSALEGKAAGEEPVLQSKTVTPSTSKQTVKPDNGYDGLSQVTVNGDVNLIAENIAEGVSIFGVSGTHSGGDTNSEEAIITRAISTYANSKITSIGSYAFQGCTNLTSVSFPVATSIGNSAFQRCTSLVSVSFPQATTIGSYAFSSCSSLTSIRFSQATTIGSYAFTDCYGLTSVSFPLTTAIGNGAFSACYRLTSINFPQATTIGSYAFYGCRSLTLVSFPVASYIGSEAFKNCSSLTSIRFPQATTIGNNAFYNCDNLTSINFPQVTTIGYYAFYSCSNLTSIRFSQATTIGSEAFDSCKNLTTVSFPLATSINYAAFSCCSNNLTSVSFPVASYIGSYAFYRCYNLVSLFLTGSSLCQLAHSNAFYSTPIGGYSASAKAYGSIYVPASLLASYKTATNWTYFSSRFVGVGSSEEEEGGSGDTITFTIGGKEYQADVGMTWGEWIESDYNTDSFSEGLGGVVNDDFMHVTYDEDLEYVGLNDEIIANGKYILRI